MPRTPKKKKKKWRARVLSKSPDRGKTIRRANPGTQKTRKKRTYTSTPGANSNEVRQLAVIARNRGKDKRNKTPKKLKEIVSKVIKTLDGVTIKESGPGNVVIKVGGGNKKTKKKYQKQTKNYKIEIIKKKH